jgi:hypothetical protein
VRPTDRPSIDVVPGLAKPIVVAIEMGYGHLRAAAPLAERLGVQALLCDRAPLAGTDEQRLWGQARRLYEGMTRLSQLPAIGRPLQAAVDSLTFIPHLHPYRDLSDPTTGARVLDRFAERGLGQGLAEHLRSTGAPLLTTFFAPAIAADRFGCEKVFCVVTDADINRVWAPIQSKRTQVRFLAPSMRVVRRLRAYGVPDTRITYTGFPLPHSLLGGPALPTLRAALATRLARLDPEGTFRAHYRDELHHFFGPLPSDSPGAPHLVFAVGGAGAQAQLAKQLLPSLAGPLRGGRMRLTLVAGIRPEVARVFDEAIDDARLDKVRGNGLDILFSDTHDDYFQRFEKLLATTDMLWTKPSELTFYGALGLPLIFCPPIGAHEVYNRRWALESGAGLKQRDPRHAAEWIADWLHDGTLAGAAWNGFMRLPKFGLYRILDAVAES